MSDRSNSAGEMLQIVGTPIPTPFRPLKWDEQPDITDRDRRELAPLLKAAADLRRRGEEEAFIAPIRV